MKQVNFERTEQTKENFLVAVSHWVTLISLMSRVPPRIDFLKQSDHVGVIF